MRKDPRVYLAQILERIDRILEYIAGGRDAFLADRRPRMPLYETWRSLAKP